jgi:hypothetical protein
MPDILIEVRKGWLAGRQSNLVEAVHNTLVGVLKHPPADKLLRLIEHAPEDFAIPHGMTDRFLGIEIVMFAGRSLETKRALYKAIVEQLLTFGVPAGDVKIVVVDVPMENVGFRGGKAACDVDLGYELDVPTPASA